MGIQINLFCKQLRVNEVIKCHLEFSAVKNDKEKSMCSSTVLTPKKENENTNNIILLPTKEASRRCNLSGTSKMEDHKSKRTKQTTYHISNRLSKHIWLHVS